MGNFKKPILYMIAIAIVGLMMTSAYGLQTISNGQSNDVQGLRILKVNKEPQFLQIQGQTVTQPQINLQGTGKANYAFPGYHPGFDRTLGGAILAAYYDLDLDNILWTFSTDNGATFDPGVYYDIGGDYPAIKYWDDQTFYGTFVTDYLDLNGGATYLMEVTDPTNYDTYGLTYWDWSTYGWSDMIDADIACDSSQQTFEWGVSSYVISSTYGSTYIDGPTIVYSDETTEGSGWIGWYYYNGCEHTDIDIDRSTVYSYAVYDWEDTTAGYYKLLCRVNDFDQIHTGYDQMFEIDYGFNLQNPAVAAGDGNIVILAETDENGNKDIVCFYGSDLNSMQTSVVVNTGDDEVFPDVRHVEGDTFVCTYVKGGNLYAYKTDDAGATWVDLTRKQINDNDDVVIEEYKTSDLCTGAVKAMWEEEGMDATEIWIGDVAPAGNAPPNTPTITGSTKLKPNKSYDFTVSTTDPDGDDLYYYIDWGDGTNTGYFGPSASGVSATKSHTWTTKAVFTIKCKAKDTNDAESGWGTLDVSTPRSRTMMFRLLDLFPNAFPVLRMLLGL